MVMAFNPDDPHDGQATDGNGFTYRMIHIGPQLVARVLADAAGRPVGLPLFAEPVLSDPVLAARLRDLHRALLGGATTLRRDELLAAVVLAAARQAATHSGTLALTAEQAPADARQVAGRARDLIVLRGYSGQLPARDSAVFYLIIGFAIIFADRRRPKSVAPSRPRWPPLTGAAAARRAGRPLCRAAETSDRRNERPQKQATGTPAWEPPSVQAGQEFDFDLPLAGLPSFV
jgi:hypothetical protein